MIKKYITNQIKKILSEGKENSVKDLKVYHGTDDKFENFSLDYTWDGFWFSDNYEAIKKGEVGASGRKYILTRYITLNKPAGWDEYEKYSIGELINLGYDGVILPDDNRIDYLVFHPESIKGEIKLENNQSKNVKPTYIFHGGDCNNVNYPSTLKR